MDDVYPNIVQLKVDLGKQLLKAHIFILFYFFNIMKLIIFFFFLQDLMGLPNIAGLRKTFGKLELTSEGLE